MIGGRLHGPDFWRSLPVEFVLLELIFEQPRAFSFVSWLNRIIRFEAGFPASDESVYQPSQEAEEPSELGLLVLVGFLEPVIGTFAGTCVVNSL